MKLSKEQQLFIDKAKWGDNILVDACIGSGKTTAIQRLCAELPLRFKILYRYRIQVTTPFVTEEGRQRVIDRLNEKFSKNENVQARCQIDFCKGKNAQILFSAIGFADVIKDDTVYELKFVSELSHEHFLQCASYMVALGLNKGVLWNTRNNECFAVSIPNVQAFMDAVVNTVTKGYLTKYYARNSYK